MSRQEVVVCPRKPVLAVGRLVPAVVLAVLARPAAAWIWPEHRDIAATAIEGMDPAQRRVLDALWADLRSVEKESKNLCPSMLDPGGQPAKAEDACVDLAAFPALAGDHSCSEGDLWQVVTKDDWTRRVVWVAAHFKKRLAEAKTDAQRDDAWNLSHLAMQGADPRYLTRAEGNNAHFLLPRESVQAHETLEAYVTRSVDPASEVNAIGIYVDFHDLALRLASLRKAASPGERADLARRALLAEGVALHFLEDAFSSGHYAATWGKASWQKGTHDLYSTIGLTTMTWSGDLFASHGDAHMTEADERTAAATIRRSFAQLAAAADGSLKVGAGPLVTAEETIESIDFCSGKSLPKPPDVPAPRKASLEVLRSTPIPAGGEEEIHPPRARAEMGPFVGVVAGYGFGPAWGGYEAPDGTRARSELEIGARLGFGLEGLLTSSMDGQIWVQALLVSDPYQLDLRCSDCPGGKRTNSLKPRVPSRSALKLGARMPYYLLPFDLILLAPALYFIDAGAMQTVVFTAANGGLLTIQRRLAGSAGSLQFMAGRQVGVTLFGYTSNEDQFISDVAPPDPGSPFALVKYRSVELDFPLVEYIAPRAFATTMSLALAVQLGFCVEFPQNAVLYQQNNAPYTLGTSWYGYLRLELDARKYF